MPFTGPGDPKISQRTRAFWKNAGATPKEKRMWVDIFNSCIDKRGATQEGLCFQIANGTVSREIKKRKGMSTLQEDLQDAGIPFEVIE